MTPEEIETRREQFHITRAALYVAHCPVCQMKGMPGYQTGVGYKCRDLLTGEKLAADEIHCERKDLVRAALNSVRSV